MENDFPIDQILQRYNMPANKDLLYSYEELRRLEIDQPFIYALLQTFEEDKAFSEKDFDKFSLEIIIDYIQRTHGYYLSKKLLEIEQSINILLKDYADNHPLLPVLNKFFNEYRVSLTTHIRAEEKQLLPYIKRLLKIENEAGDVEVYKEATKDYSVQSFIDSHHDTEKDLSDVRNAILEYQPPITNQTPYRILVTQLEAFEKDLFVHALIEDKVLIPRVLNLEEKLSKHFKDKSKLN
jgi:regulator of cell morphogenesis and NO signaling